MPQSGGRLAILIVTLALATLLAANVIASIILWMAGDWKEHAWGLNLALKIMWGSWLSLCAAALLTRITFYGWHYRKLRPGEVPQSLRQMLAADLKPSAWLKGGATSFTITVVLVSLLGMSILATIVLWIVGDWQTSGTALGWAVKIIWGAWWLLCIAIVLIRVAIFGRMRVKAGYATPPPTPPKQEATEEKQP